MTLYFYTSHQLLGVRGQEIGWKLGTEVTTLDTLLAGQGFSKSWHVSAYPSGQCVAAAFLQAALAGLDRCEV